MRFLAFVLLLASVAIVDPRAGTAQQDPVSTMRAIRVKPPVAAPVVTFQTLDGQPTGLEMLRGRPVMLTFFSTT